MNVSAIFPSSSLSQVNSLQSADQQRRTEFKELAQALQSGNLTNAQQAVGALTRSATSSGAPSLQWMQQLNPLRLALQSGDLAGARDAYATVQQNSNPLAAHHHRPDHIGAGARVLTSGFPSSTGNSDMIAGSPSDFFQPVNLTV